MVGILLAWIGMVLGVLLIVLLAVPFRIDLHGQADDRKGLSYEMALDWALGVITIIAFHGEPVRMFFLGFRIGSFSMESWKRKKAEKKSKKKRLSPRSLFQWTKKHFHHFSTILKRFVDAVFLRGYVEGWIGLSDPADTARIGLLSQIIGISKDRFTLAVHCVYDREIVRINARVRATLILGYLGMIALRVMFQKETRIMIRGPVRT